MIQNIPSRSNIMPVYYKKGGSVEPPFEGLTFTAKDANSNAIQFLAFLDCHLKGFKLLPKIKRLV